MALLYDTLFAISEGSCRPVRLVCIANATYFETKALMPSSEDPGVHRPLSGRVVAELVAGTELAAAAGGAEILLVEPIGNRPDAEVIDLVAIVRNTNVPTVIIDKTLDPFCLDRLLPVLPNDVLVVAIDSLTKFAQLGTNVAIGGVAFLVARSPSVQQRAARIAKEVRALAAAVGQHMDHRLALAMAPNRATIEARLSMMRRNALLLATWLRKERRGTIDHADGAEGGSTLVYVTWRIPSPRRSVLEFRTRLEKRGASIPVTVEWRDAYLETVFTYLEEALARRPMLAPVRLGTSFGFTQTAIGAIATRTELGSAVLRVSAGMESVEGLREIYLVLREVLTHEAERTRTPAAANDGSQRQTREKLL